MRYNLLSTFLNFVETAPRKKKSVLLIAVDLAVMMGALYCAYALQHNAVYPAETLKQPLQQPLKQPWTLSLILAAALIIFSYVLGLSKTALRSFDIRGGQLLVCVSVLLSLTALIAGTLLGGRGAASAAIIFGALFFLIAFMVRVVSMLAINALQEAGSNRTPVLIYGAGAAGVQLVSALRVSGDLKPTAFIDDNKLKHKQIVHGLRVYSAKNIERLIKQKKIERILIAIPFLTWPQRENLIKRLGHLPCTIEIMPSHIDMIHKKDVLESLIPVNADDLLGRDKTAGLDGLARGHLETYKDKSVLVSGAGGSIGLELCHQVLKHSPTQLILFERSEFALYKAERALRSIADELGVDLIPVLGSINDTAQLKHVFAAYEIQVVFHAAAYKHVPLLEDNEIVGLKNNVMGTYHLAEHALQANVETFILISSDKAVRPTNLMGGTKRLAELVIQDFNSRSKTTKFSMVRFGNVLGSSGSVIPLFKEQIAAGGPITLTHEDVTRYFMSISEAARLVMDAGSLADGGEVFMLDMGAPVKIKDLAVNLIKKYNLSVRNEANPQGSIEIVIIGLRPGEKLHEELVIDAEVLSTPHPKIMRVVEKSLAAKDMRRVIKNIEKAIAANDVSKAKAIIARWVETK